MISITMKADRVKQSSVAGAAPPARTEQTPRPAPRSVAASKECADIVMWNVNDPELYHSDHLVVRHMYDADHAAVVWFGFQPGQVLKDHETSSTALVQVLKGEIRLNAVEEHVMSAGQTVELPPGQRHALTALTDALVQLVLVPHPRYHSLAQELGMAMRP